MKKKVLIIEDEENIANAQAIILKELYDVHHAFDGEEGLKKARQLKPHLIVLDLMLPKKNGYEVCYNIRQDKSLKDTKVVMVTAKNQQVDKDKGEFIGADYYITKPFDPEQLLEAVEKVMAQ